MQRGLLLVGMLGLLSMPILLVTGCAPTVITVAPNPQYGQAVANAESLWNAGRREEAVNEYIRVWNWQPYDVNLLLLYGERAAAVGNSRWALVFYKQAEVVAGSNPTVLRSVYEGYARTYERMGNRDQAEYWKLRAIRLAGPPLVIRPRVIVGPPYTGAPPTVGEQPTPPLSAAAQPAPPKVERIPTPPVVERVPTPAPGAAGPESRPTLERPAIERLAPTSGTQPSPALEPSPTPALKRVTPKRLERPLPAESQPTPTPTPTPAPTPLAESLPPSVKQVQPAESPSATGIARVTEISGPEVTFNAGRRQGVRFGDRLRVQSNSGDRDLGEVEVIRVEEATAVGRLSTTEGDVRPFDKVILRK
jgi:hypothetical protein